MALGTKHQAVLAVPWIIYLHWSKHDGNGRNKALDIAVGLAAMALVASPFYFRNYYYFGNPLWPLMQQVFPPRGDYLDIVARSFMESSIGTHSLSEAVSTLREIIVYPLIPCTVWIMGLVAVILTRSRLDIGTGFILFFGLWWIVVPKFYWRLSIYMLPFAVIAIGVLLDHLRQRRLLWGLKLLHLGIAITLLYGVGIGVWYSKGLLAWHTEEGRKNYHHATFYYDEYMWINENLPEDAKLMVFVRSALTFYLDREYVRADPKLSAGVDWRRIRTLEAFLAELRELEIDYVLFSRRVLGGVEEAKHLPQLIDDLIASDSAEVVWTHNDVKLFSSRIRGLYTTDDVTLLKISRRKAAASM
jgi:hypothetical protein